MEKEEIVMKAHHIYVTLQHKTRLKSQILESEILVLRENVLQEPSTNYYNIEYQYYNTIIFTEIWPS
jgi:hypothetical protein